jgi:hypothetical protein
MTISCLFTGNLGNHMFQYALTRTVAEHNGYEWGFNPTPTYDYFNGKPQMDFMKIDYGIEMYPRVFSNVWKEPEINGFSPYTPEVFDIPDDTLLNIHCGQDARYYDKEKLRQWFKPKNDLFLGLDDTYCVINVRGGEYKGVQDLILPRDYWNKAIWYMRSIRPNMQFIVITDDVPYAENLLQLSAHHFSIEVDYQYILKAKFLILSNSSFAILPAWMNENNPFVIAPKYWARPYQNHWMNSDIWTFGFHFLDRDGNINW